MTLNDLLLIFNGCVALFSAIYMMYYGIKVYANHMPIRRIVYVTIGLAMLWHVIAILLAVSGIVEYKELGEIVEYSTLIRPLVFVYFLTPVAIDMVQRKFGGIK